MPDLTFSPTAEPGTRFGLEELKPYPIVPRASRFHSQHLEDALDPWSKEALSREALACDHPAALTGEACPDHGYYCARRPR